MPQLTEVKLRAIKPNGKIERYHDSQGLYLEVSKAGGKAGRDRGAACPQGSGQNTGGI